ncbi:putative electron transfer flavoprotein subunit [Actinomortierella ambigua]|nr:putative electron transfer flavoprotein subunit [Actinomortierella ambigua]
MSEFAVNMLDMSFLSDFDPATSAAVMATISTATCPPSTTVAPLLASSFPSADSLPTSVPLSTPSVPAQTVSQEQQQQRPSPFDLQACFTPQEAVNHDDWMMGGLAFDDMGSNLSSPVDMPLPTPTNTTPSFSFSSRSSTPTTTSTNNAVKNNFIRSAGLFPQFEFGQFQEYQLGQDSDSLLSWVAPSSYLTAAKQALTGQHSPLQSIVPPDYTASLIQQQLQLQQQQQQQQQEQCTKSAEQQAQGVVSTSAPQPLAIKGLATPPETPSSTPSPLCLKPLPSPERVRQMSPLSPTSPMPMLMPAPTSAPAFVVQSHEPQLQPQQASGPQSPQDGALAASDDLRASKMIKQRKPSKSTIKAAAGMGVRCQNCGVTVTPLWRRSANNEPLCNACGLYHKLHAMDRPKHLQTLGGSKKGLSTTLTPLWRKDDKGEILCNACGLYYKLHHVHRPISLKQNVIRRRVRYENGHATAGANGRRASAQARVHHSLAQSGGAVAASAALARVPMIPGGAGHPLHPLGPAPPMPLAAATVGVPTANGTIPAGLQPFPGHPGHGHPQHVHHAAHHHTQQAPQQQAHPAHHPAHAVMAGHVQHVHPLAHAQAHTMGFVAAHGFPTHHHIHQTLPTQ